MKYRASNTIRLLVACAAASAMLVTASALRAARPAETSPAASTSTAPAGEPLRVALITLATDPQASDPNAPAAVAAFARAMKSNAAGLPPKLAGRPVRYQIVAAVRGDLNLADYDVAILLPEWAQLLPAIDESAKAVAAFVSRGGGLVVFQPNPLKVYPAGAKPPHALAEQNIADEYCTPALLPMRATFYNRYRQNEAVRNVAGSQHPITRDLSDEQMPFPADQIFSLDSRWQVLARGATSDSPSLVVGQWGRGRIVLIADNVFGIRRRQPPATVVARSLLWAAGRPDAVVRAATAETPELPTVVMSAEPASEDGEGQWRPRAIEDDFLPASVDANDPTQPLAIAGGPTSSSTSAATKSVLTRTLENARSGDVVRLQPGLYEVGPLVVPDGVTLVGAGAANTVLKVTCAVQMGGGLELRGQCVVEDMTITSTGRKMGYMVRANGQDATPTLRRCVLLPGDREFCAVAAWNKAAPTISHCVVVSPAGNYGVFARADAAPKIEYCTIVSRGFGIGLQGCSAPAIRRCIIVGQRPGVLIQADCNPTIADCVLFCRGGSATYCYPISRWSPGDANTPQPAKPVVDSAAEIITRRDILVLDPKLKLGPGLADYLRPDDSTEAANYGAYSETPAWPKHVPNAPKVKLPDLKAVLNGQ